MAAPHASSDSAEVEFAVPAIAPPPPPLRDDDDESLEPPAKRRRSLGFNASPAIEPPAPLFRHLVFVLHGIGEQKSKFEANVNLLRHSVHNMRGFFPRLASYDLDFVGIEWHSAIHDRDNAKTLREITLDSVPTLRNFQTNFLGDIMFYVCHSEPVLRDICTKLNAAYRDWVAGVPEPHRIGVSILAHSMGAIAVWDLLHGKESILEDLAFRPSHFFAVGSPISALALFRNEASLTVPGETRFFNIFHPYDPLAYRLEALINPAFRGVPPAEVPHWDGGKRIHRILSERMRGVIWSDAGAKTKEQNSDDDDDSSANLGDMRVMDSQVRTDFQLQEHPFEAGSEYLSCLRSHFSYWGSRDVALFILRRTTAKHRATADQTAAASAAAAAAAATPPPQSSTSSAVPLGVGILSSLAGLGRRQ